MFRGMTGRGPYLAGAACAGVAVAFLGYRVGWMPLTWHGPLARGFEIGSAALLATSWQLLRRSERRQAPVALALLAALVGLVVAGVAARWLAPPLPALPLRVYELPGFSISLPAAPVTTRDQDYSAGRVELDDIADLGAKITLRWEPGELLDDAALQLAASTVIDVSGGGSRTSVVERWQGPGGAEVATVIIDVPRGRLWGSLVMCGERQISLFSGDHRTMGELHRRILPTIVCRPDPALEAQAQQMPWTIALPKGWGSVEPKLKGQVELINGAQVLLLRRSARVIDRDSLRKTLQSTFTASGMQVTVGEGTGEFMPLLGSLEGESTVGWVWPIACELGSVVLIALTTEPASADELAALARTKGRCLARGETPPPWPTDGP